jgi:hypothetical protein
LWFSRPARNQGETWELRRLSDAPFALVEVFENGIKPEIREEILRDAENRLREIKTKIFERAILLKWRVKHFSQTPYLIL